MNPKSNKTHCRKSPQSYLKQKQILLSKFSNKIQNIRNNILRGLINGHIYIVMFLPPTGDQSPRSDQFLGLSPKNTYNPKLISSGKD